MRIWFKEWKENRMLRDFVACEENDDTRTHKIFHALEQACYEFKQAALSGFEYCRI